jgi:hypothetical protein
MLQDDVEQPGSEAYNVLINMHQKYGWAVNAKVIRCLLHHRCIQASDVRLRVGAACIVHVPV